MTSYEKKMIYGRFQNRAIWAFLQETFHLLRAWMWFEFDLMTRFYFMTTAVLILCPLRDRTNARRGIAGPLR